MNDEMGLIYDDDAAAHFAHTTTGIDEASVKAVLRSRDRYHVGLGIYPPEVVEEETPEAIRAKHPDLFPAAHMTNRYLEPALEREYVVRDTGLELDDVAAVLHADVEYMRKRGIID